MNHLTLPVITNYSRQYARKAITDNILRFETEMDKI